MTDRAVAGGLGRIAVGTSGWSYDHWASEFYPDGLAAGKRLAYYGTRLPTVEADSTFYRLPSEVAVRRWATDVPDGFAFAAKGSRFVTHFRRLEGVEDAVAGFMERLSLLGPALEVVLWQLPPNLARDPGLLDRFCALLPPTVRHAIEFRDPSWLVSDVFDVLREHGCAQVQVSSDAMPQDLTVTSDFVYVRFHDTEAYHGAYLEPALEPWAAFLRQQAESGRDGYAYFNNDAEGHAPKDASRLIEMLGDAAYRLGTGPAAAAED